MNKLVIPALVFLSAGGCAPAEAAAPSAAVPQSAPASPQATAAPPPAGPTVPVSMPSASPAAHPISDQDPLHQRIDQLAEQLSAQVIEYRRHIHQHPELSNREFETGKYVAQKLRELGWQVQYPFAKTGVVGVLRGGRPGPVVGIRAELDALPVTEEVDLPFKSTVRAAFDGQAVGVAHACGHDAHMGIVLGVAALFAQMKDQLPGTVKLIFQPGEEAPPAGEEDGAQLMLEEGVLSKDPKVDVIFGVHTMPALETGQLGYRAKGLLAGSDDFVIVVHGRQTHAGMPWTGLDPIVIASQIVLGMQTITSRQMDLVKAPVAVTVGKFVSGVRPNIIPEDATLKGILRSFDPQMRADLRLRVKRTAEDIAASAGATADVTFPGEAGCPSVYNDPILTTRMLPTLKRTVGEANLLEISPQPAADDFGMFDEKVPGLFLLMGVRKPGATLDEYPPNHSPRFKVDESSLRVGVRTLANLTVDYMLGAQ